MRLKDRPVGAQSTETGRFTFCLERSATGTEVVRDNGIVATGEVRDWLLLFSHILGGLSMVVEPRVHAKVVSDLGRDGIMDDADALQGCLPHLRQLLLASCPDWPYLSDRSYAHPATRPAMKSRGLQTAPHEWGLKSPVSRMPSTSSHPSMTECCPSLHTGVQPSSWESKASSRHEDGRRPDTNRAWPGG